MGAGEGRGINGAPLRAAAAGAEEEMGRGKEEEEEETEDKEEDECEGQGAGVARRMVKRASGGGGMMAVMRPNRPQTVTLAGS